MLGAGCGRHSELSSQTLSPRLSPPSLLTEHGPGGYLGSPNDDQDTSPGLLLLGEPCDLALANIRERLLKRFWKGHSSLI